LDALHAWSADDVRERIDALQASGKAQIVARQGVRFWSAAGAFYPKEDHG
jgi:hypothetical protein